MGSSAKRRWCDEDDGFRKAGFLVPNPNLNI